MKLIPSGCTCARPKAKACKLNAQAGGKLRRLDYPFQGQRKTLSMGAHRSALPALATTRSTHVLPAGAMRDGCICSRGTARATDRIEEDACSATD